MRTKILGILALAVLVALPALAAPIGSVDGPISGNNGVTGVVPFIGWGLAASGVRHVDIDVDGVYVGRAQYGRSRPDVARALPGFPDSAAAGWVFRLNSTHFLNGLHTLSAKVVANDGSSTHLPGVIFETTNDTSLLVPFGRMQRPQRHAELWGSCQSPHQRRYTSFDGFALDAGAELGSNTGTPGDSGVFNVQLLVDGVVIADTRTDCSYDASLGGWLNCYGLRRFDIERNHPSLPDSPHAGWRFVIDIGALLNNGWVQGQHVFTVKARDISGNIADIDETVLQILCSESIANERSFGFIGGPRQGPIAGTVILTGWALDWEGVASVEIFVNGTNVGTATYGLPLANVFRWYPSYVDAAAAGFSFPLDSTLAANGQSLEVQVRVRDVRGVTTVIGERTFAVNN